METLRRYGFVDPKPGDSMLARFGPGPKGLMAAEVRPLDGSKVLGPTELAFPDELHRLSGHRAPRRLDGASGCS